MQIVLTNRFRTHFKIQAYPGAIFFDDRALTALQASAVSTALLYSFIMGLRDHHVAAAHAL